MVRCGTCVASAALLWCVLASAGEEPKSEAPKAGYAGIQVRSGDEGKGILVVSVIAGSPAETAGLQMDDLILQVNGQAVGNLESFVQTIRGFKPGEKIQFRVRRGEKEMDVSVVLGEAPKNIDK